MAYSRSRLHNPIVRPPRGPRTPNHIPASLNPLASNRNAHIVRLYSVLVHLVSLPPSPTTSVQLVRAWRALAGCREVHLGVLWRLGAAVIDRTRDSVGFGETARDDGDDDDARQERAERRAEWLKACQEGLVDRVDKFGEYALALVAAGRIDFALDELDGLSLLSLSLPPSPCEPPVASTTDSLPHVAISTINRITTRSRSTRCTASSPSFRRNPLRFLTPVVPTHLPARPTRPHHRLTTNPRACHKRGCGEGEGRRMGRGSELA